jgi:hypothetical protein
MKIIAVNNRGSLLPNLWCLCSIHFNPVILACNDQLIAVSLDVGGISFGIAAVYASTCYIKRRKLWSNLSTMVSQYPIPWSFIGDFNTILGAHEHRGSCVPVSTPITDFQTWTNNLNLLHLPTHGVFFTWANGRRGGQYTQRRLDRVICNQAWINVCSSVNVSTLTKINSDHFPLLLDFSTEPSQFSSSFKFLKMWTAHQDCINIVRSCWNISIPGCPMFVLGQKLKILKDKLKTWNKVNFGNITANVTAATAKVDEIQRMIDINGASGDLLNQEKLAQINLENVLHMEELFWSEKSKVKWHLEGDRNTAYFHRIAKIKNTTNHISSLMNGDVALNSSNEVSAHVVDHFSSLFTQAGSFVDNGLVEEVIPNLITDRINDMLTNIPSMEEIKSAVFSLNNDSAPGPDGFGACFFQTYWDIISQDVINAVLQFFTTGWILPNFNSNTIVLIPKVSNANSLNQYRPIALANFKFKILSKIIADRLASIMPAITSVQQRGFIKGRSIKDCICLTSEAINVLHKKSVIGNLALKVDIAKAFDTLNWDFLLKVLKCFGFSQRFCKWILAILQSAKLSISINGN